MHKILERLSSEDRGMSTVEYAVGTCGAGGIGGLLYYLLTSDDAKNLIWTVIQSAFDFLG